MLVQHEVYKDMDPEYSVLRYSDSKREKRKKEYSVLQYIAKIKVDFVQVNCFSFAIFLKLFIYLFFTFGHLCTFKP